MKNKFDTIHNNNLDGWGFAFRDSQIFRFKKYINIINKYKICGHVLEIGCSSGFFTNHYLKHIHNIHIKAIDISQIAIEKGKSRYKDIDFSVDSLPCTMFKDNSFNLVTVIELLNYLTEEEQKQSMFEVARILKDDSYILVSVNIGNKPYFSLHAIRKLLNEKFNIIYEDGVYIRTYYRYIEVPLFRLLDLFSSSEKYKIKDRDKKTKRMLKYVVNFFVRNDIVYYTYGFIIRSTLKFLLYHMPIKQIDFISKFLSSKEQSIYIALAKKVKDTK